MEFIESAKLMLLDRQIRVLGIYDMSKGARSGVIMDPKVIFGIALKGAAYSIIVAHNHPSGSLTPSKSDLELTDKIRHGGDFLELKLSDHLIITKEGYYSFMDEGYIPQKN